MFRWMIRLSLAAALVAMAGCTTLKLKDLSGDMPAGLAAEYRNSNKTIADDAFVWIPLVASSGGQVAKTAEGFRATEASTFGPLGILQISVTSADYDSEGRIKHWRQQWEYAWGFLFGFRSYGAHEAGVRESGNSVKILFGLLGNEANSRGEHVFYFLYIPIVTSRGAAAQPPSSETKPAEQPAEAAGQTPPVKEQP